MRRYLLDTAPLAALLLARPAAVDLISPWLHHHEVATSILAYAEVVEYIKDFSDAARRQPLADLTPEDLRLLVSQRVALAHVLPIAVRLLTENPLISGDYYDGDLLLAVVGVPDNGWNRLSVTVSRPAAAITGLPDAATANLPKGSTEVLARFVATYR
jgi:hypothetical protein